MPTIEFANKAAMAAQIAEASGYTGLAQALNQMAYAAITESGSGHRFCRSSGLTEDVATPQLLRPLHS